MVTKFQNYFFKDLKQFQSLYTKLQEVVSIPIRLIHCVRNPYDTISTMMLNQLKQTLQQRDLMSKVRKEALHNEKRTALQKR